MKYRIGELARLLNTSEHTLRYYEKLGLVIPEREPNNIRSYNEDNKKWAEFILHMKDTGMSLEDLKKYIDLSREGSEGLTDLLQILYNHRKQVEAKLTIYQDNLTLLSKKIQFYEDVQKGSADKDLYEKFVSDNKC
jgi:DNA-binding transcriptional MerR regulator